MQGPEPTAIPVPLARMVHDLNQPLSAISTYAHAGKHMIDNGMTNTAQLKELFGKIAHQCERAKVLSHALGNAVKDLPPGKDPS